MGRLTQVCRRQVGKLHFWSSTPAVLTRGYLMIGYVFYALAIGATIAVFGTPSLLQTVSRPFTTGVGVILFAACLLASYGAQCGTKYRTELLGVTVAACTMSVYFSAALSTLFVRGNVDDLRITFTGVVFVATAALWARAMTLMPLFAYEVFVLGKDDQQ